MNWKQSFESIYNEIAGREPAPGGGSAAALAGSLAAGLLHMVDQISHPGHPEGRRAEDMMRLGEELGALAEADTKAYLAVVEAYRMPKNRPEETQERNRAIQQALRQAAEVPLETARRGGRLLRMAVRIAETCKPNCISDLGVALLLLDTAVKGGIMNVRANFPGLKDAELMRNLGEEAEEIITQTRERREAIDVILRQRSLAVQA